MLIEGGEERDRRVRLDSRGGEHHDLPAIGRGERVDHLCERSDRSLLAIELLLGPGDDLVLDALRLGEPEPRREARRVAAVIPDVVLELHALAVAEPRKGRAILELLERLVDAGPVGGREQEDAEVLLEHRHRHAVSPFGARREELTQLPEGLVAGAILERGLIDVEDEIRRRDRFRRRGRSHRERGQVLRRECGCGRGARRREVLDRHRAAVHQKLEIVLIQVQDPSLLAVGHDDIDVHDLDLDALRKGLFGGFRRLCQARSSCNCKREAGEQAENLRPARADGQGREPRLPWLLRRLYCRESKACARNRLRPGCRRAERARRRRGRGAI